MEVLRARLPLLEPFRTAGGVVAFRDVVFVAVHEDGPHPGWAEAAPYPGATEDDADSVWEGLVVGGAASAMTAAAVENAGADADARSKATTLVAAIGGGGGEPVRSLALGLDIPVAAAARTVESGGYGAVKVKITPAVAAERLEAVRAVVSGAVVGADANGSFDPNDPEHSAVLRRLDVAYLEQPYPRGNLAAHARLRREVGYPIALDEDVRSLDDGRAVITTEAADLLVLKPGVLGIGAAVALHDAARAAGLRVKASGLMESSIGRAYTTAVARLPGAAFSDVAPATAFLAVDPVEELAWGIGVGLDRDAVDPYVVDHAVV